MDSARVVLRCGPESLCSQELTETENLPSRETPSFALHRVEQLTQPRQR